MDTDKLRDLMITDEDKSHSLKLKPIGLVQTCSLKPITQGEVNSIKHKTLKVSLTIVNHPKEAVGQ
jgi:hypothetical protein